MKPTIPATAAEAPELALYGIVRIVSEHFEFGGYRYTNLADAVAQAKRAGEPGR